MVQIATRRDDDFSASSSALAVEETAQATVSTELGNGARGAVSITGPGSSTAQGMSSNAASSGEPVLQAAVVWISSDSDDDMSVSSADGLPVMESTVENVPTVTEPLTPGEPSSLAEFLNEEPAAATATSESGQAFYPTAKGGAVKLDGADVFDLEATD